jgi:hypothetical protein
MGIGSAVCRLKNELRGGERRIKKSNIDGVNWIKAHCMHVVNNTMKFLCTINLC